MLIGQIAIVAMVMIFMIVGYVKNKDGKTKMSHFWWFLANSQITVYAWMFGTWVFFGIALGFALWHLHKFITTEEVS